MISPSRLALTAALLAGLVVPSAALAKGGDRPTTGTGTPTPTTKPAPAPSQTAGAICDAAALRNDTMTYPSPGGCVVVRVDTTPGVAAATLVLERAVAAPGFTTNIKYAGVGPLSTVGVRFTNKQAGLRYEVTTQLGKVVIDGR